VPIPPRSKQGVLMSNLSVFTAYCTTPSIINRSVFAKSKSAASAPLPPVAARCPPSDSAARSTAQLAPRRHLLHLFPEQHPPRFLRVALKTGHRCQCGLLRFLPSPPRDLLAPWSEFAVAIREPVQSLLGCRLRVTRDFLVGLPRMSPVFEV
jgi:hypothetical protein